MNLAHQISIRTPTRLLSLLLYSSLFILLTLSIQPLTAQTSTTASDTAYIAGSVTDAATGQPLPDATISVNGVVIGTSDRAGQYRVTVNVSGAYLIADITITAPVTVPGRGSYTMQATALQPGVTRLLNPVALGTQNITEQDGIIPGSIQRTAADYAAIRSLNNRPLRPEILPGKPLEPLLPQSDVSEIEIPLTIKVGLTPYIHCSDWVNAGMPIDEVIEMDFKEYIRNVLPNEWVSTWLPQSLQTGAMAGKSFAWWRLTLNDPRPQGADVVDNTCDQVFIQNSRRDTTDAAIDATWHYRMSRENQIIEIHYLAYDWQCENLGWEVCMGQWDTQYKAEAGWVWQDILQHYYTPVDINVTHTIAPKTNVVTNSSFDQADWFWFFSGGLTGLNFDDGIMRFQRKVDSANPATAYQDLNVIVPKASPLRVTLFLGNSSNAEKTVSVRLRDTETLDGAIECQFTLDAGLPLQKYAVYGENPVSWTGMRVEVVGETADDLPAYLVDKVKAQYRPNGKPDDVPACDAPRPGVPTVDAPAADTTHGKLVTVALLEGASNLRPGYSAAFHVQVSTAADFADLVFDNAADLATDPLLTIPLTADGSYYLRARQFDGIDRYSRWSAVVPFTVLILPETPTIIAPVGEVSAAGLTFTWALADDTTQYKLAFRDSAGNPLKAAKFTPAQANCDAETDQCSVTVSTVTTQNGVSFAIGSTYDWKVIAKNANGKTKTAFIPFTLTAEALLSGIGR